MANEKPHVVTTMQWKWVVIGVVVGTAVISIMGGITASAFHNIFIPTLTGLIGFMVMGIIVGYYSPGVTIREAAVGGAILALLFLFLPLTFFVEGFSVMQKLTAVVLCFVLALVGGWVGENLQKERGPGPRGLHWRWVAIGVIVGFILNCLGVFMLAPLFGYNLKAVFATFLVTFVVAGYIVGYFSPGVTIREAALAGVLTVILDWVLIASGLGISVSTKDMLFGMTAGFFLSMVGAWAGERLQVSIQLKKSAS